MQLLLLFWNQCLEIKHFDQEMYDKRNFSVSGSKGYEAV